MDTERLKFNMQILLLLQEALVETKSVLSSVLLECFHCNSIRSYPFPLKDLFSGGMLNEITRRCCFRFPPELWIP